MYNRNSISSAPTQALAIDSYCLLCVPSEKQLPSAVSTDFVDTFRKILDKVATDGRPLQKPNASADFLESVRNHNDILNKLSLPLIRPASNKVKILDNEYLRQDGLRGSSILLNDSCNVITMLLITKIKRSIAILSEN